MKRSAVAAATLMSGLTLAACGGHGSNPGPTAATVAAAQPLTLRDVPGVGRVLVDSGGDAVYTNDQERGGAAVCDSSCTAFWKPVKAPSGNAPKAAAVRRLGLLKRSDGTLQLSSNGQPLYTFSEDSPGTVKGDRFSDEFNGHHFTWHVVRASSGAANSDAPATTDQNTGSPAGSSATGGGSYSGY
jgi:predicted lipoprotein with Yx(FWY)xxD motif